LWEVRGEVKREGSRGERREEKGKKELALVVEGSTFSPYLF